MATSQRHLASALKILSVDTKNQRNRLTVLFWLGITYIEKPQTQCFYCQPVVVMSPQSESLVNCSHHPHLEHLQYTNTSLASCVFQTKQLNMFSHEKKEIKRNQSLFSSNTRVTRLHNIKYVFYRFQLVNQQRTEEENVIKILSFNLQHTNLLRHEQAFFKDIYIYIQPLQMPVQGH